ncbi:HpcH/HpaI aldolase/citrate lyase family protein [Rhodovulum euryhalinum]|uniref:(3S)-malyl-CoA thioesterase n=1 Tax=Rhodovulum euryhalinum TaxID=35805 RepID=A0A4R2KEK5_9RHOB|nr:CoA ester lyase [Rhodovulum euryhalinum]TCO72061.1 (3S)-malyl-CoA thioesterase [Rhodovulum euryhalinum]
MDLRARPFRSVLYIPASKARALEKAKTLPVDAIIFDLEDAVAAEEKPAARKLLAEMLAEGGFGPRFCIVRINGLDTEWGADDVAALRGAGAHAVLLPKVETTAQLDALGDAIPGVELWAMMETPRGVLNADALAAHPRLGGFVMGTNDLIKELRCRPRPDRMPLLTSLGQCLLAARAHGIVAIDGVYNAFRDEEGLRAECAQGRDLGFDGKSLIHPDQVAAANAVFAPTVAEIDLSRRQIAAFDEARRKGLGIAVVDGRIVENLHIVTARETLAKAAAIAELETVT